MAIATPNFGGLVLGMTNLYIGVTPNLLSRWYMSVGGYFSNLRNPHNISFAFSDLNDFPNSCGLMWSYCFIAMEKMATFVRKKTKTDRT